MKHVLVIKKIIIKIVEMHLPKASAYHRKMYLENDFITRNDY